MPSSPLTVRWPPCWARSWMRWRRTMLPCSPSSSRLARLRRPNRSRHLTGSSVDRGAQQLLHGHSWNHDAPPQSDRRKLTPGDELVGEASGDVQQVGRFVHGQHEAIGWCWCRQRAPFVEVVVVADGVHGVSPFSVESTVSILRVNVTLGADNVTLAAVS